QTDCSISNTCCPFAYNWPSLLFWANQTGVNFFDTAGVYSDGIAEEVLGPTIRDNKPDQLLMSKIIPLNKIIGQLLRFSTRFRLIAPNPIGAETRYFYPFNIS